MALLLIINESPVDYEVAGLTINDAEWPFTLVIPFDLFHFLIHSPSLSFNGRSSLLAH